nr:unnamed protein product [Callosobruchus analis]
MNDSLAQQGQLLKELFLLKTHFTSPHLLELYNEEKRHYRNNLVQAKKDYYAGIIRGSSNKSKAVWRVINYEIGRVKKSPDSIVLNIDVVELLIPMSRTRNNRRKTLPTKRNTKRGIRRSRLYGPEIRTKLFYSDSMKFVTGTSTTNYSWVYGYEIDFSASQMLALLPDKTREIKLLKAVNYVTCYMYPDDQQSVVALEWKAPTTNQYYPTTATLTGTSQGDPASLYWCAVIIQDRDGDNGDTVKFNNLAEVRRYTPRKNFRIGPETSIFKFTTVWTPQEPSEQEWLGMKSTGNASKVYKLYVLGSHLNPTDWASPNNTKKSRTIGIELDCVWHVVYRGRISTVSLPRVSTTCSSDADFEVIELNKTYNPLSDDEEESDRETAVTNIRSKKIRPDRQSWKKNMYKTKVAGGKERRTRNVMSQILNHRLLLLMMFSNTLKAPSVHQPE